MKQNLYTTFIGAKGVAFAWIGAAIAPMFFAIGLSPEYRVHMLVGIIAFIIVVFSIADGIKAIRAKSVSGLIAYAIIPSSLLIVSVVYTWLSFETLN